MPHNFSKWGSSPFFATIIAGCSESMMSADPGADVHAVIQNIQAPFTGAIFTTDVTCSGVNLNIFGSKEDVYLDGGPVSPHASGFPDGSYYVKVTEPDGTLLGTSINSGNDTPAQVTNGEF
jgi:hypothetical protein